MEHCPGSHLCAEHNFICSRSVGTSTGSLAAEERAPEEMGQPKPQQENGRAGFFAAFRENQHMSKMYKDSVSDSL